MGFTTGPRLGQFEILEPLGAGGMGEVYRARDTRLDRIVAIKLLPTEVVNAPGRKVERLRREARIIARITHPNICTLHDVGEDGATTFLVMEYVDGETLARRLEDGPLPLPLALRTAIGIADALDYAHRLGVVHRDLKPSNIMLTRDRVKLLDFGLAKLTARDEEQLTDSTWSGQLTDVGIIVGTVPYMAPEQIEGREVDARTDIFAFGVMLYEMVSGRRPFAGDSRASLMAAIVAAEPPTLTSVQPEAPAPLERLVLRCLAKDPDDRWQTARDLAAELRWISGAGQGVTTPDITRRPSRAALWGGLLGAALTTAVVGGTLPWIWPEPPVAEFRPVTFRRGVVSSARFAPDGRSFVYSASWDGQPYAAFHGRSEGLDVRDLQLEDARVLSISKSGDMAVLFGPQNIQRAFGVRTLARIPMAGGARRDLLTGVMDADWIPGTDALAVIRDPGAGRPWTVEFPAGTTVHEARAAWSLRVSPDGSRVAFFEGPALFGGAPRAMITVIDRSGGKSTVAQGWSGYGLAWAPSGREVWFTATRPQLGAPYVHAVSLSGAERTVHRAPDWLVLHDISADRRVLLARNSIRFSTACRQSADAHERDLTWTMASSVRALSSDGKTLILEDALSAALSGNPMLFRRSIDGAPAVQIGEGTGGDLSPDGKWLLGGFQDSLVLWPTGAGAMVTLPKGNLKHVRMGWVGRTLERGGAWLSDSRRIVFTGQTADGRSRGYIQEIPAGTPRAITPDGVVLAGNAAVRDDHSVLGRAGGEWKVYPIQGGDSRPVPALTPDDFPLQWSHDGRYVYVVASVDEARARSPGVDVFRVELATGRRVLWKTLMPADPVGVEDIRETVVITPDAQSYCYSYVRRLGDLFVVDGLK
jgi:eukaryotic-like serine/threonine-protein kinase